jgi:hypothetical protein
MMRKPCVYFLHPAPRSSEPSHWLDVELQKDRTEDYKGRPGGDGGQNLMRSAVDGNGIHNYILLPHIMLQEVIFQNFGRCNR